MGLDVVMLGSPTLKEMKEDSEARAVDIFALACGT
jgi:hypothetical protein